jgi:peptidoglycan/LPS O-acetylase OafA/YrhL
MGFLRLFFALSVVSGHSGTTVFGFNGVGSGLAVNLFFIISGFYMSMVLNEKYKDTPVMTFYKSRALRLFPTYYIGLVLVVLVTGSFFIGVFDQLTIFNKIFFLFQNIFIVGQDVSAVVCSETISGTCLDPIHMTMNPPAWSLSVELIFYILAPFIVKSPKRTFAFFMYGLLYLIACAYIKAPISVDFMQNATHKSFYYFFYPSSFVFFASGALSYHFSKGSFRPNYVITIIVLILSTMAYTEFPLWQTLVISTVIPLIFEVTKKNNFDRMIGEISFPAYILHIPILIFITQHQYLLPLDKDMISIGTYTAIIVCIIGLLCNFLIENRIDNYRHNKLIEKPNGFIFLLVKYFILPITFIFPVFVMAYIFAS